MPHKFTNYLFSIIAEYLSEDGNKPDSFMKKDAI